MKSIVRLNADEKEILKARNLTVHEAIMLLRKTENPREIVTSINNSSEVTSNRSSEVTSPFALYQSEEEMNTHGFLVKDIIDIDLSKNRIILEKNGGGTWFYVFKKGEISISTMQLIEQRKTEEWPVLGMAYFKRGVGKQLSLIEIRV
jgi:hypothetical protein